MSTEYIRYPNNSGGGSSGVSSLNSLTGALTLVAGANITITPGAGSLTIASSAGGSVTSVGLTTANSAIFTISNTPITSTGDIDISLSSQTQNLFLSSPNGSSGVPSFRAIVAADIPSLSSLYLNLNASNSPMTGNLLLNPAFQISTNSACTIGQATTIAATTLSWKQAIAAATLSRLQVNPTYNNGTGGVGATLTSATNVVLPVIDGYSAIVGDRIGVFHETSALKNGIYVVTDLGTAGVSPWILTRSTDADSTAGLDKAAVQAGNGSQIGIIFEQQTNAPTVGVSAITFVNILSGIDVADEVTLTKTGNVFSIKPLGITNAYVANGAGISWSKLEAGNTNSWAFFDGSGILQTRTMAPGFVAVTDPGDGSPNYTSMCTYTEVGYLNGATSNIQAQINALQPAITPGTTLQYFRGDLTFQTLNTLAVPELTNLYYTNARGIASTLSGYVSGAGTISAADSILSAIQKLNGNIGALVSGVSSVFGRTGAVIAVSGDYNTSLVTENTNLYFTDGRAQAAITGGASSIVTSNLTASRALASDGGGKVAVSATTSTELGFVSGVTSAIQTQLNSLQPTITGAATTIVSSNLTASRAVVSDGAGKIAVSATTSAEIGFVSGVTSAIQTQLNGKQASGSYITALTGDVTAAGPGSAAATLANTAVAPGSYTYGSFTVNSKGLLTAASSGATPAPASAQYVTLALDGTLGNERTLAVGSQFNLVDGGANNPVTISPKGPGAHNLTMDDFVDSGLLFTSTIAGAGSAAAVVPPTAAMGFANGVAQFQTGTTATGRASVGQPIATGTSLGNTANSNTYEARIMFPALSTGVQRFTSIVGFNNSFTAIGTNNACFLYSDNINGGVWQCRTTSGGTATNTSAAVTVAINTWYKLTIAVNAAGTSVVFSINGTVVATHTTNIPTGTNTVSNQSAIIKSIGATTSIMLADYISIESIWATSR